jgi:hypothetical protein
MFLPFLIRKSPLLARSASGGTKDKKFQFEGKIGWRPLLKNGPFKGWLGCLFPLEPSSK